MALTKFNKVVLSVLKGLLQINGLWPFTFNRSTNTFHAHFGLRLYALVLLIFTTTLCLRCINLVRYEYGSQTTSRPQTIRIYIFPIVSLIYMLMAHLVQHMQAHGQRTLFNTAISTLAKISNPPLPRSIVYTSYFNVQNIVLLVILNVVQVGVYYNLVRMVAPQASNDLITVFFWILPNVVQTILPDAINGLIMVLGYHYRLLNAKLSEVIDIAQHVSGDVVSSDDMRRPKGLRMQTFCDLADRLDQIAIHHQELTTLTHQLFDTVQKQLLLWIYYCSFMFVSGLFYAFFLVSVSVNKQKQDFKIATFLTNIGIFGLIFRRLYRLATECAAAKSEAHFSGKILHRIYLHRDVDIRFKRSVEMFSVQLMNTPLVISACGLFAIDYSMIFAVWNKPDIGHLGFLKLAVPAGIAMLLLTISVDSLFWNRWLWPEGEVLWFNTILNKSSDYGTSPFLWYFYSALPRAMGLSMFLVPVGLFYESRTRAICIPAIVFVLLYSVLPHKELRFIVYVFPVLNVAAASACHRLWSNRNKSLIGAFWACVAGGHLTLNVFLTLFLLLISGTNYPGGVAMSRLHRIASAESNVSVHICNLAAQSGVSRFTEINEEWTYSKDEFIKPGDPELHGFAYLLAEPSGKHSEDTLFLQETHEVLEFVECFSSIGLQYRSMLPVKIKTKPCLWIMRRKKSVGSMEIKERVRHRMLEMRLKQQLQNNQTDLIEEEERLREVEDPFEEDRIRNVLKTQQQAPKSDAYHHVKEEEHGDYNEETEDDSTEEPPLVLQKPSRHGARLIESRNEPADGEPSSSIDDDMLHKKSRTGARLKELVVSHYRSKGRIVESGDNTSAEIVSHEAPPSAILHDQPSKPSISMKTSIKRIIKAEKIKEMVERISTVDLQDACDLEHMSTKECLRKLIDEYDEQDID